MNSSKYTEKMLKAGRKRYTERQIFVRKLIPTAIVFAIITLCLCGYLLSFFRFQMDMFGGIIRDPVQEGYYNDKGNGFAQHMISIATYDDEFFAYYSAIYDDEGNPYIVPEETVLLMYKEGENGRDYLMINEANAHCVDSLRNKYHTEDDDVYPLYSCCVTRYYSDGEYFIPAEITVKDRSNNVVEEFRTEETIPEGFSEYVCDAEDTSRLIFCDNNANQECVDFLAQAENPICYYYADDYKVYTSSIYIDNEHYTIVEMILVKTDVIIKKILKLAAPVALLLTLLVTLLITSRKYSELKAHYAVEDYRKDMTNKLAHDLKSPLMAISGYAENLENNIHTEKREHYAAAILDNVKYMDSIISDVLDLSKLEDGSFKTEMIELDAAALIREIASNYETALEKKDLKLTINGSAAPMSDKSLMTTILDNLIGNAVKYADESGRIIIECKSNQINITNDCDNADKLDISTLAEPFVKGDSSRSGKTGSGLGLSIASEAARRMGYTLKLQANDKKFSAILSWK